MRVEATIPDARGIALGELAAELQLSRSQIIDEALALFMNAVLEMRRGRKLVTVSATGKGITREIITPTLAQLEWTTSRQTLELPVEAVQKMAELIENPPRANNALRHLMSGKTK
jgi:hypothetical protein